MGGHARAHLRAPAIDAAEEAALARLEARIGRLHLRQRLGLEQDYEARIFRKDRHFWHFEDWHSIHGLIRGSLRLAGLHRRGRRNARRFEICRHAVVLPHLPAAFDGFTLLQLTDLHVDIAEGFTEALVAAIAPLDYDLCVLTGDYRARTFGPFQAVLDGLARLRAGLKGEPVAILGNHDSIRMVPGMEAAGYRVLLNESSVIRRDGDAMHLAGIEDAHYYRLENFHRAAGDIPQGAVSVLLSHTPEPYRRAAHAGFDLMLCGHTHGGQICLPGGVPVLTDADSPRAVARGAWRHHGMIGYTSRGAGTSIVDIRLNCPPEITLHRLRRAR